MTLKCWSAPASHHRNGPSPLVVEPNASVLRPSAGSNSSGPSNSSSGRSLEPRNMGRGRATPKSNRCRSQSSNWDKDAVEHSGESGDDDGLHPLDATAATLPTPSHQIHAIPALWVSSRRRHHRGRSRRRSTSETYGNLSRASSGFRSHHIYHAPPIGSSSSSSSLLSEEQEQLREATTATATTAGRPLNQRLRITMPDGPPFSGWVRGQAADVQWEALDPSVQCVRIDVCNVAWTVPTTIAHRVGNDGTFHWRRVYWGMPIAEGYYVNIYDATEQKDASDSLLLAQSERFAVIK
uniref:Uncharacterized protein n=1 Tax=Peronospora matthiolae TaxID=2874970 RepID=A0AAV1URG3_9STRA